MILNNITLNSNSGTIGSNGDTTAMDTWEDRRISITLQYGSLKEVLVLERSDEPQVNSVPFHKILNKLATA